MFRSDRWWTLVLVLALMGAMFRLPAFLALAAALFVVLGAAEWWQKHALDGVVYRRRFHYIRGFPGEVTGLQVEVENRKLLPLSWLRVQDAWPKAVGPQDGTLLAPSHLPEQGFLTHVFSLRWFQRVRRSYALLLRQRGVYEVGPVQLETGDLFGFFEQRKEAGETETMTVFPHLLSLQEIGLPAEDPFGDRRVRRHLFEDVNRPMGVREYHPEDEFRRVHWPATAHTGELQVKVYQPTSAPVMVICMNAATFARHWEGYYPVLLEYLVEVAGTLANEGLQQGYRVGLISNGCLAHADQPFRIPPGRTAQQLARLLEALAAVTPLVTGPFEEFLLREVPRVPYGATLVVLTGVKDEEQPRSLGLAETLLRLKQHERRIVLVSLAEEAPQTVPGVMIRHLPLRETDSHMPDRLQRFSEEEPVQAIRGG